MEGAPPDRSDGPSISNRMGSITRTFQKDTSMEDAYPDRPDGNTREFKLPKYISPHPDPHALAQNSSAQE